MGKLFVFCIGGSGSRVMKSLAMMLAAGVKVNADKIIPIVIDPDISNADLVRNEQLLKSYQRIHKELHGEKTNEQIPFFSTKIEGLEQSSNFTMQLPNISNEEFRDFIGYMGLQDANKRMAQMLFSERNLHTHMNVGFKGNPNMGSVALNQFAGMERYVQFCNSFQQGDRIFVISSIFGGTGAAGFPLLMKNLRNGDPKLPGQDRIKEAPIGAVSILPYFNLQVSDQSEIDSGTFISKTKAALGYYARTIHDEVNVTYYVGDTPKKDYENVEGGSGQRNNSHFIEVAAATAIIDFMKMPADDLRATNGRVDTPFCKEFGIDDFGNTIDFKSLRHAFSEDTRQVLTQLAMLKLFSDGRMASDVKKPHPWAKDLLQPGFMEAGFYQELRKFLESYQKEWLEEMASNEVSFKPFNMKVGEDNLNRILEGIEPKSEGWLSKKNYEALTSMLNEAAKTCKTQPTDPQKFAAAFAQASQAFISDKLNLN